jgi:hypothetical protein
LHAYLNVAFIALFVLASCAPLLSTRAEPCASMSPGCTPGSARARLLKQRADVRPPAAVSAPPATPIAMVTATTRVAKKIKVAERSLPHNLEAETSVLGAILVDNDACQVAAQLLNPTDFYRDAHRRVFEKMLALNERGQAIDFVTLKEELSQAGELDVVGGPAYVASLAEGVPRATNVEYYARIVREKATLRATIAVAENISTRAYGGQVDDAAVRALSDVVQQGAAPIQFYSARELAKFTPPAVDWIIPGYVAAGAITDLSGPPKAAGKTTLLADWVRAVLDGSPCMGIPGAVASRSPVVYLTEQTKTTFRLVMKRAGMLERDDLRILTRWDIKGRRWPEVAAAALQEAQRIGSRVIVVDTFPQFANLAGDSENNAGDALTALEPLQRITAAGLAVITARHDRKGGGEIGESARGSSAFTGGVDIVLRLTRPRGQQRPTVRVLEGMSRFDETPASVVIEKVAADCAHADPSGIEVWAERFVVLGDTEAVAAEETKAALLDVLPTEARLALRMDELVERTERPRVTVERVLKQIPDLQKTGKGGKADPKRYYRSDCAQTPIPGVWGGQNGFHFDSDAFGTGGEQ